ncbi:integrator complex subunit 4-like [Ruditapes philippinarum]|uniref:integrator complex subunit 4-like n=1 Tax=Ruditapes philippinarum TaxID=129788 RepID=UPI00295AD787|nr:integrator complex subunit 4-like [Ruditapes philippinarum]
MFNTSESQKAKSQLISSLSVIGQSAASLKELHKQLVDTAIQNLTSDSHHIRSSCLSLIGHLESHDLPKGDNKDDDVTDVQKLLEKFFQDQDSRVRSSAFEALLTFHERGVKLDESLYKAAWEALNDDYEGVRLAAIQVVWVLSHLYPESVVPVPNSDEELRLVDDGFVKICNMINDISVKVRTKAASLLGSLHLVSTRFLEQTLDKKLMSNMRRKKTASERAKDNYSSGVWSTGQKWADDAPKEELDPESINLMNIGACGAFVHGLEDEFSEVRNCTLDSICELASQNPGFALLCQDSIADMFNDEIESVRLNAINSLKKLSQHLELREDQLDIMLGVLQDFSYVSRESLRDMLCEMKFATKECLNTCVVALLDNLRRYPEDRLNIWKCMKFLGKNCANLALPLMPEFLCLHPYFDTPEPEMDDPAYISILVLVFNAAAGNRTALPMFQEHTWRHFTYLRDSIPELVPDLKTDDSKEVLVENMAQVEKSHEAATFIKCTVEKLSDLRSLDTITAKQLLETAVRDLQRVIELDMNTSASAECICLFLQSQLLITQLMSQHAYILTGSVTVSNLNVLVDKVLNLTNRLQTLFLGLGNNDLSLIKQTELKALTFRLGSTLANSQELATQMKAQDVYTNYLCGLQKFLTYTDSHTDSCTSYLISELVNLKSNQLSNVQNVLHSALKLVRPVTCMLMNKVRKAYAVIHEPAKVSDNPIKFTAGLTAAVLLIADIENVSRIENVRVQVKYPDTTVALTIPSSHDVRKRSALGHRLTTHVLLSHGHWSESCTVEIGVVILSSSAAKTKFKTKSASSSEEDSNVIELCKPVKVLISPKPHKR